MGASQLQQSWPPIFHSLKEAPHIQHASLGHMAGRPLQGACLSTMFLFYRICCLQQNCPEIAECLSIVSLLKMTKAFCF